MTTSRDINECIRVGTDEGTHGQPDRHTVWYDRVTGETFSTYCFAQPSGMTGFGRGEYPVKEAVDETPGRIRWFDGWTEREAIRASVDSPSE
jgi:hypothetical protein